MLYEVITLPVSVGCNYAQQIIFIVKLGEVKPGFQCSAFALVNSVAHHVHFVCYLIKILLALLFASVIHYDNIIESCFRQVINAFFV